MVNATTLAQNYQAQEKSVDKKRFALEASSRRMSQTLKSLRECIRAGESTGDLSLDLMYLQDGAPDREVADFYKKIQIKIAGKASALVVAAFSTRGAYDDAHDSPVIDQGITLIYAGVLTDDKLVVERERGVGLLQTKRHLFFVSHLQRIDGGSIHIAAPKAYPYHIAGVELYIGQDIEELYRKYDTFRSFVLEKKNEYILKQLPDMPIPELVLR